MKWGLNIATKRRIKDEEEAGKKWREKGEKPPYIRSISGNLQAYQIRGRSTLDKIQLIATIEDSPPRQVKSREVPIASGDVQQMVELKTIV